MNRTIHNIGYNNNSAQSNKPSRRWNMDVTDISRRSTLAGACQMDVEPLERGSREVEDSKKSGRRVVEESKKGMRSRFLRVAFSFAMVMFCVLGAKGQLSDGLYYISGPKASGNGVSGDGFNASDPLTYYYLCPTEEWMYFKSTTPFYTTDDNGKPFMTTYQCRKVEGYNSDKAVWYVQKKDNTNFYYIRHVIDGKYLVFNRALGSGSANRVRIHIQTVDDLDVTADSALFAITTYGSGSNQCYHIHPKLDADGWLCNVTDGNKPTLKAQGKTDGPNSMAMGGTIGRWNTEGEATSKWYFESSALCHAPTIRNVGQGLYEIDPPFSLPSGYSIHYTTDDALTPGNNGSTYNGSVPITENCTLRAWIVAFDMRISEIAEQSVFTGTPPPTFEVLCDDMLQINCLADDAEIYYTINDPNPSSTNGTLYATPFTTGLSDDDVVYAIAYLSGSPSDVANYTYHPNTPAPTVTLSPTEASISFEGNPTIYYTTDGTDPDENGGGSTTTYDGTSPASITINQDQNIEIRVIAKLSDRGASCPVTVKKRPKRPTIMAESSCDGTSRLHQLTFTGTETGKTYWYALSNGNNSSAPALNTFTQYTGVVVDITGIPGWDGTTLLVTLHAYAKDADGNPSVVRSINYSMNYTEAPLISYAIGQDNTTVTIEAADGATIHYTIDGGGETTTTENPVSFTVNNGQNHTIVATAQVSGQELSCENTYVIYLPTTIYDLSGISDMDGSYKLGCNIAVGSGFESIGPFSGYFDGDGYTISGLSTPLFNTVNGGIVKNVMLDNVSISNGTNVGAICNEATGASRIYNCGVLATNSTIATDEDGYTNIITSSSTISGSNYVGGIVGLLDGSSRVINCFSYANITEGAEVGGIVGHNNVATTSGNLKTMVMNCMFYGDIDNDGCDSIAPIYNGEKITNTGSTGVSNFNYFWSGASFVQDKHIDVYNCALAAETRFLQRFEFFRHLLNSHRAMAAWWVTGNRNDKDEIMKWVMIPDSIGTTTPYPILKTPGKYPSVVNYDAASAVTGKPRNQGGRLGTLSVHIQMGSGGAQFGPPTGATITKADTTLIITDKDTTHFNFNFYKVQLPYYNDVGTNNYTKASNGTSRVVTGWKIVSITGGTAGTYSTGEDVTFTDGEITATPYNFADRHCTDKDLYSVSGRVFNQGAYWDVPEGVTAITIEPYWAKAVYVADAYADVVYNSDMATKYDVPNVGGGNIYSNGTNYTIAGSSQKVYASISNAIASTALNPNTSHTVNDYAVVLVGNCHQYGSIESKKPYTLTSIDLDHDNEPDYALILRFDGRTQFHPVKYDFVALIGLGMAQKSTSGKGTYNFGIPQPLGWFEATNTSLFRVTQFEFDRTNRAAKPIILHGGVMEQWVSGQSNGVANQTLYYHVGGNVWFKEFHIGCHQDKSDIATKHPPVSVTGGDFNEFYLTGLYATTINYDDNAECYVNGGRFGTVAGTGMEGIGNASTHANGRITWLIDHADIKEFFAGGTNAAKIAEGNIYTKICNSYVDRFYGGPKFGDMNSGRTVKTTANNCTFGYFFGAGYGGNSYYTAAPGNFTNIADAWYSDDDKGYNLDWDKWVRGKIKGTHVNNGNYSNGVVYKGYWRKYISQFGGVATAIDYQFLPFSDNKINVGRLFVKFVKFSLATTRSVTSTLTDCTIENNFYGGGSLGKVDGNVVSSLDGCTVNGDVFGAGYSATVPTVPVMNTGGFKDNEVCQEADYPCNQPYYDKGLGVYLPGKFPDIIDYTWEYDPENHNVTSTETAVDSVNHILYTTVNLAKTELGSVQGNVTLTIKGNSTISGSVYGGGEESVVGASGNPVVITITLQDDTHVNGSVFGGGDQGEVVGEAAVTVKGEAIVGQNVFGGGNEASVGQNTTVNLQGNATVHGNVYGGGNNGPVGGNSEVRIE